MGNLAEEFTGKLVRGTEIKSDLRVRSSSFVTKTVDKRLLSDYEGAEWEIHRENKKTVVLKKPKTHFALFEDRVWVILAKMGFTALNKADIRLPCADDESIPGKQIDVLAADDETVIVVECKSSETMAKKHFSKELNEYEKVISCGNKVLRKVFSEKHKIRYIFTTNNISLSDNDRNRLQELGMAHFNQDDIFYYEQLLNTVGAAAKYQLLAKLFRDQEIHALKNQIPAIRGKMGGYHYYSFSIEPEKLLKISYILHRVNITHEDGGYQRLVTKGRLKEIEEFVNDGGYFPNSIILNINTKRDDPLYFDKIAAPHHDSTLTDPVILHLPKRYHSAFIIDGQHRLYGYSNTKYRATNSIPVVAFENLPAEEQINLFVQINSKQRPVSKNLLTTIGAELMWNSDKYDEALSALMSKLLTELGTRDDSPLYRRIIIGDKKMTAATCITLDTIIVYGFKKSGFFAKLNKKKLVETGYLWLDPKREDGTFDYKNMLDKSYLFFRTYFDHVREKTAKIWNLGRDPGGFVAMNIGILCFIRISSDLLAFIKKYEGVDYTTKDGKEIAEATFMYLEPVFAYINGLDAQQIDQFRKYGSNASGVETGVRKFQREIHCTFKDFDPEGLQKWIVESSGKFNDVTRTFTEKMEEGIKQTVFSVLQEKFGSNWWKDSVPTEIQKSAAIMRIEAKSDEHDSEFLHLPDYKKIISKHWEPFKPIFSDPAFKSNKDNQLEWFDTLISLRNKVAHIKKVGQEDHAFVVQLNEWLPGRLGMAKMNTAV
jgi:DNA sulfur modification protein DndB